ncbi:MAG: N-acetylmuramoyl-L-alanine amidase [Tidjanibacter sp.]|nr:N-acetylmuramoyl-L-alanine amidase [Tidjanibacter sp.]
MKATTRFLMILTLCLPFVVSAQTKNELPDVAIDCVVIDAGHGGKDPGCSWGGNLEKDLNLRVALRFGAMIEQAYPDVKVIYTRKDDRFIELHERGDIANRAGADLFISIHTDAVGNNTAHGNSTYIMGNDKSEKNLAVAQRENSVIVMEGDYEAKYEGYDPNSAESFIIFSLMQYAYSEQSMIFAEMVQKHYSLNTPITNRGARQAPYLVLWRTAMPAVLTELGFMTNKSDRDYLLSPEGEQAVSKALFDAFSEYRTKCADKANLAQPQQPQQPQAEVKAEQPKVEEPKAEVKAEEPKAEVKKEEPKPQEQTVVKQEPKEEPLKFYAQLCTLSAKSNPNDGKFGHYKGRIVQKQTASGKWRCMVEGKDYDEAKRIAAEADKRGFKGAFVVAFRGDKWIPLAEAR